MSSTGGGDGYCHRSACWDVYCGCNFEASCYACSCDRSGRSNGALGGSTILDSHGTRCVASASDLTLDGEVGAARERPEQAEHEARDGYRRDEGDGDEDDCR